MKIFCFGTCSGRTVLVFAHLYKEKIMDLLRTCANLLRTCVILHCIIYREALISKPLPTNLHSVMSQVIQVLNSIKSRRI